MSLQVVRSGWLVGAAFLLSFIQTSASAQEVYDDSYVVQLTGASKSAALSVNGTFLNSTTLVVHPDTAAATLADESKQVNWKKVSRECRSIRRNIGPANVKSCEPNWLVKSSDVPNDTYYSSLWGMNQISAPAAWDVSTGSSSVVVAVIDTGVDYNHPDLAANIWTNSAETANGKDDDGNGCVDDIHGCNFVYGTGNPMDDNGHGTHVSGTIGAVGNNDTGVAGVSWNVKIMALKFLSANGAGSIAGAIGALNYMTLMKQRGVNIRVSNNSWGGGGFSQALNQAIQDARQAGVIIVAAAGNEANDNDSFASYPAGYEGVVSVAALEQDGNLAYFSNYGSNSVDIAAPGTSILSTYPGSTYARLSGTSMATPHVTGALALLLGYDTSMSDSAAVTRLLESGVPSATLDGVVRTGRRIDLARMLNGETTPIESPSAPPSSCSYQVSQLSEARPTDADSAEPVFQNVDEFNFSKVSLPFKFSFDGMSGSSLTLSPNGLAYFETQPSSMDYEVEGHTPANAFGFQTDLVSSVRYAAQSDRAVISWQGYSYSNPSAGTVDFTMALSQEGAIKMWLHFSSNEVKKIFRAQSILGLTGRSNNHFTVARNSNIRDLGVELTPACGSGDGVKKVRLSGSDGSTVISGPFLMSVVAAQAGSQQLEAQFSLDGTTCPATVPVSLSAKNAQLKGRVSNQALRLFKRIEVSVGGKTGHARLARESGARRSSVSPEQLDSVCSQISGSIRRVR